MIFVHKKKIQKIPNIYFILGSDACEKNDNVLFFTHCVYGTKEKGALQAISVLLPGCWYWHK